MSATKSSNHQENFQAKDDDKPEGAAFEKLLLSLPETFVYKIPPLLNAGGFRAEEWDLANPIITACTRIYQAEKFVRVVLFRYVDNTSRSTSDENLSIFAECPFEIKPKEGIVGIVDEVHDSSRYFVLRIKDPKSSKTIRLGIGFTERDTAFDFRCCLNDCIRYVDRMLKADQISSDELCNQDDKDHDVSSAPIPQLKDLSIKEGAKIKINLGLSGRPRHANSSGSSTLETGHGKLSIIKPITSPAKETPATQADSNPDNEEWSDFT